LIYWIENIMRTERQFAIWSLVSTFIGGCAAQSQTTTSNCEPRAATEAQCVVPPARKLGTLTLGDPIPVVVDAKCKWNRTGILLEQHAVYAVTSKEREEDRWVDKRQESDLTKGWKGAFWGFVASLLQSGARAPELPLYSLVAAQGETKGIFSVVGHQGTVFSKVVDGDPPTELLFFANDWPSKYHNNHGCVDVTVRRIQ
jgi:hypothetical protein